MFGLMARYINLNLNLNLNNNKKVVVVVPNETLAAKQQEKYSPWASKDIGDLALDTSISYCTYADFLLGTIPTTATLLVDEVDSLFFGDDPVVSGGRLLSTILLLNKYRVIGMTATFRGERGANMMKYFLKDSSIFTTGAAVPEKNLD